MITHVKVARSSFKGHFCFSCAPQQISKAGTHITSTFQMRTQGGGHPAAEWHGRVSKQISLGCLSPYQATAFPAQLLRPGPQALRPGWVPAFGANSSRSQQLGGKAINASLRYITINMIIGIRRRKCGPSERQQGARGRARERDKQCRRKLQRELGPRGPASGEG